MLAAWPCALAAAVLDLPWPRQLGPGDALPTAGIHAIAEDATGYLWMAGSDGLLRFDGRRARVWRREEGLVDAALCALHVDALDRLWLGTVSQGVLMMPVDRRGFERPPAHAPRALRDGKVHAIASSADGTVWVVGADRQLYQRRVEDGRWQALEVAAAAVTALATDRDDVLWVGTTHGLRRIRQGRVERIDTHAAAVLAVWADPQGGVHVRGADGLAVLDAHARRIGARASGQPLLRTDDGALWLQQAAGLVLQQGDHRQPVPLRPLHGPRHLPVDIRQALQDRGGDLWLLSRAHGLWRLPVHWRTFTALPIARDGLPGIRSQYALALAGSHDGRLWVAGSHGRLQRLDLRTGASSDHLDYAHTGLGTTVAVGMVEDLRRRLWVASAGQLLRYDPTRGQVRRWSLQLPSTGGALHLQACGDGSVWLAHAGQIQQWSADGRRLLADTPQALGLARGMASRQLLCDRSGRLWAGDREGLRYWDAAQRRFVATGAASTTVAAIAEADDGSLWLSRQDALEQHRWDGRALHRLRRFDAAHGYPLLRADALAVDAQGVVWAGAARGLIRVDPGRGEVCVSGTADGLPVQEILGHRLVRLRGGALAAAVREGGLLLLEPAGVQDRQPVPVLVINAVRLRRAGAGLSLRPDSAPVALSSTDRDIQIAINLLGRGDPDRIQHRFHLLGTDPDWVDTGPVAQRVFAQLPVGAHTLAIQARHGDGPWSLPQRLALQVAPAWWQTSAGQAALAVAALLMLVVAGRAARCLARQRRHAHAARVQQRHAEQASAERSRFLGSLGQRIRLPMTAVSGWSELLLQGPLSPCQRGQAESLHRAGQHLVQLMDDALDLASIEAGRLQVQNAAFAPAPLLVDLHELLLPVAQAKRLALVLDSDLGPDCWLLGDAQRVRQILLNLIGNALKFTARGQVRVCARRGADGRGLVLAVTDTGAGMCAAQMRRLFLRFEQADGAGTLARHGGSGLGLAISRALARAMGGDIQVSSHPGRGSCFEVGLPLPDGEAVPGCTVAATQALPVGPPLRVVLVLPHAETADVVAALLRAQGAQVHRARDVGVAPPAAQDDAFDLVVADPDLRIDDEGMATLLARCWPGVARLALTARADANAERDALAAGFGLFLRLPFDRAALAAVLARCRERR